MSHRKGLKLLLFEPLSQATPSAEGSAGVAGKGRVLADESLRLGGQVLIHWVGNTSEEPPGTGGIGKL